MELIMSILNILFFLIGCIIVLRIFLSGRRTERMVNAINARLIEDEIKRARHVELMTVEIGAMDRSREELRAQVAECKTHLEEMYKQGGIDGE